MSYQVVIRLGTDGWRRETVLLDEFQGKRDITEIIAAKITRDRKIGMKFCVCLPQTRKENNKKTLVGGGQ